MRAKSDVLSKFQIFQADMSNLVPGCKIRGLHSDNGGEFTSRKFRLYCRRQRIVRTFTGPYAPQQNGIAERSNRTVVEMARMPQD
jgi:transposase InsO family protein